MSRLCGSWAGATLRQERGLGLLVEAVRGQEGSYVQSLVSE